jgi:hypothetical protein
MLNWLVLVVPEGKTLPVPGIVDNALGGNKSFNVRFWDNDRSCFEAEWFFPAKVTPVTKLYQHEIHLSPKDALKNHLPEIVVKLLTEVKTLKAIEGLRHEGGRGI